MANGSYEDRITTVIDEVLLVAVPDPDEDLIDSGLLDSLALISLITEIEHEFGFHLPLDDFDIEKFRSVRRIAAFVRAIEPESERA